MSDVTEPTLKYRLSGWPRSRPDESLHHVPYYRSGWGFGLWLKRHARIAPMFGSKKTIVEQLSKVIADLAAARIGWWWMGFSKHVVEFELPYARTQGFTTTTWTAATAREFISAFVTSGQVVSEDGNSSLSSGDGVVWGQVAIGEISLNIRLCSRNGPRLARCLRQLASALDASIPLAAHGKKLPDMPCIPGDSVPNAA